MMNKQNLAYLAGYTDGDGCFYLGRVGKKFRSSFIVSSSNPKVLYEIRSFLTGHVKIRQPANEIQKPWGQWTITGDRAKEVAKSILPFLVQRKKECEIFLNYFETRSHKEKMNLIDSIKTARKEDLVKQEDFKKLKALSKSSEPSTFDLIYLAGFIDAECCLTVQRDLPKNKPNPTFKAIIRLNDTRSTIFYWLISKFGGCITWVNKPKNYNPQLIWILRGKNACELLKRIIPYLKYKRPVAIKVIEFYETILINGGARHTQAFRDAYSIVLANREEIVKEIRKLNHKGL